METLIKKYLGKCVVCYHPREIKVHGVVIGIDTNDSSLPFFVECTYPSLNCSFGIPKSGMVWAEGCGPNGRHHGYWVDHVRKCRKI